MLKCISIIILRNFFFVLTLVLSLLPAGDLKMQLVYCSVEGCFGTVGSDLFFLVAMRNLLAVFNGIVSILKSPLCIAFVPTTPGRCCFSAHEVLQILGR